MRFKDFLSETIDTDKFSHDYSNRNVKSILDIDDFSGLTVRNFDFHRNQLTDLKGAPKECNTFRVDNNHIKSLEGIPEIIKGFLLMKHNKLTNLKNIHKQIKLIDRGANFNDNPITSNVLGLVMINGHYKLINIFQPRTEWQKVMTILNKHLLGDKDVMEAREDLVATGYKEYAKL